MARLTFKDGYGRWAFLIIGRQYNGNVANKLAQYENLGDPEDLAPVVRCKDCVNFKQGKIHGSCDIHCNGVGEEEVVKKDFFCAYGERAVANDS